VVDEGNGRVLNYRAASGVTVTIPGFNSPRAVGVDPLDATAWVCDEVAGRVYHLRFDGQIEPQSIGPLNRPVDAAVDPGDGFVWVCELGANRVSRYDLGQPQWNVGVPAPSRVAVDSVTHEGWVTSFTQGIVTRVSPNGQVLGTFTGFTAPLGVAVDGRRGRIWVADPRASRVTALRRDGTEEFRVSNLTDAGELAVDPTTGEAWVVLGATGSTARLSPAGVVLRVQGGFDFPYAIGIDPGGR
jgi:DNA-binding beta-propeller fold protein YncE